MGGKISRHKQKERKERTEREKKRRIVDRTITKKRK